MKEKPLRLGILTSGRGSNLQSIIDHIEQGKLKAEIMVILSDNKEAQALKRGEKHCLPTQFVDKKSFQNRSQFDLALADLLKERQVDLVCLAGFMRILSSVFIERFRQKIINIHPSLLPSFPGLDAQKQALEYGVKISGCTVHFVEEKVDAGPIILQAAVPVESSDDVESLSKRILEKEHVIYPQAIGLIASGIIPIAK